ncbi:hypothetical protein QM646_00470 [Rhodococcus erythropolis]|nr:hypothetical protein [Rhodococcus erythropolis]
MTSYGALKTGLERASVIGTWPGFDFEEHSVKVTTLSSQSHAHYLAFQLTQLSGSAWDAAMWLDTYPSIEAAIAQLITQLRSSNSIVPQTFSITGLRRG